MLVLTRKIGQDFDITDMGGMGGNIKIVILHKKGDQIRIGIDAPKTFTITRSDMKKDKDKNIIKTAENQEVK